MRKMVFPVLAVMLLFLTLVNDVWAQDETFADKFLGNPLLILTIVIIAALVAMVFHQIRK